MWGGRWGKGKGRGWEGWGVIEGEDSKIERRRQRQRQQGDNERYTA
jgi:hypothetical protein